MSNKAKSKTATERASLYKTARRWETNRKRNLEKTLKAQPNNEQVKKAMQSMVYRRKTPKTQEWSASWIATAKLFKQFTGKFDRSIMNSNEKIAAEATRTSRKDRPFVMPINRDPKSFFSILARSNLNSST